MTLTSSVPDAGAPDARARGAAAAGSARAAGADAAAGAVVDAAVGAAVGAFPAGPGEPPSDCPLCAGALEPMPGMPGYVRHRSTRLSERCALTTHHHQPDELTVRGARDVRVSARHRARFVEQWERHYVLVRRVWPAFTMSRFTTVLACADVQDLWSYPSLRDDDLAAVLLALAGFIRVRDERAPTDPEPDGDAVRWVRFWFEARVRDVGDLWTAGTDAPRLFRVDYREPLTTLFPTGAQVQAWQPVDGVRDAWAQLDAAPMPDIAPSDHAAFARFVARAPMRDWA